MFESMNAVSRVERERELWIRQMKMGKKRYLFMHAVIFGGATFTLLRGVIYFGAVLDNPLKGSFGLGWHECGRVVWDGLSSGVWWSILWPARRPARQPV